LLLEAYRECLRDVFDMPALIEILKELEERKLRVHVVETRKPSPFASSLLFSYVATFLYDGDAPLAERRAQALTIDQDQLRELLGEADLRELLDADAIAQVEETAQCLAESHRAPSADGIHDLCLRLGDLSRAELAFRIADVSLLESVPRLIRARRLLDLNIAGERRLIAAEDAARYRDALGIPLPPGLALALLEPVAHPVLELVRRYARTHGPFTLRECADRFALDSEAVEAALRHLAAEGRVLEGGFRPGGVHSEWCDAEILRLIRRKSLARLRREVEPVEQRTLARFLTHWQGVLAPRRGSSQGGQNLDALLDAIESLQGAPLPASLLESSILPARIADYAPAGLDTLIAAGEVTWAGVEPIGERNGRIALFLADKLPLLAQQRPLTEPLTEREEKILSVLESAGASFFDPLHQCIGGGYPGETLDALWSLVWRGLITNDSLHALRAYIARPDSARAPRRTHAQTTFRSRRTTPPTAQGRWSALPLRAMKGTGFSPYINAEKGEGALAPEPQTVGAPGPDSGTWERTPASTPSARAGEHEVSGHDFSRAEGITKLERALAPEPQTVGAPSFERSLLEGWESTNPARPDPATGTTMGAPGPDSRTWERTNSSQPGTHEVSGHDRGTHAVPGSRAESSNEVLKGTGFSPYVNLSQSTGALAPEGSPTTTESAHALALQLLNRYGILLREYVAAENIPGGFSAVYGVLKALEESGRIRRGYFVAGLGATQFALPAAVDLLRQLRADPPAEKPEFVLLAAADPANPYGAALPWPDLPTMDDDNESAPRILTRAAYAEVILRNGRLVAWMRRGNPNLLVFLPADEPERAQVAAGLAHFLSTRGQAQLHANSHHGSSYGGALITTLNGQPVAAHPLARFLMDAGFHPGPLGMHLRRIPLPIAQAHPHHPEVQ
jgi:hypothetical protein